MELTKIMIENFRSIKSETIHIEHNCMILLGKNEAGKSNILKAIAAVFGKYQVTDKDKRKRIDNEIIKDNNYFVRVVIKLSEPDFQIIYDCFIGEYTNINLISFKNKKTLLDFIKTVFYNFLIRIDIAENKTPYFAYWNYSINDFEFENDIYLNGLNFNIDKLGTKQNTDDLRKRLFDVIVEIYKESPYQCHYWQYSDSLLLPSRIDINNFISYPEEYESLKNMFILCNRQDIKKEFDDAKRQDGDYDNLLVQISNEVTKTFKSIWKDFKDSSIELKPNGDYEMLIKIVNKAKYNFEDRSDGFRKFITILLMLSTGARSEQIGDRDIILIDEPDQSLYPTSAEHLRDELLRIAKTARVIYTTHSPYMIDSNCIDRHLIIEKNDDVTIIKKHDENAPFRDDELLRRAIGTTIFETIKPKNIIFEGWLDKELFNKYCNYHNMTKDFKETGIIYLQGIFKVDALVQLLISVNKKFVIVTDSDKASNNKRKDFENNYLEYVSAWLSYSDAVQGIITMEDFISTELIEKCLQKECNTFLYNDSKTAIENIDDVIKDDKEKKQRIKKDIIKELKKKDINDTYHTFINELKNKIENI